MSERKLRVLVIAEAANPEWTSVPLVGWSHTLALSKVCDVHLATQVRNKEAIERFGWQDGKEFSAINTEKIDGPIYKLATFLRGGNNLAWTLQTAMSSLTYPYFEYRIWKTFQAQLEKGEFDLVHRITPVSPTSPSYIAKKLKNIDVPFVVGPLNGGVAWPKEFPEMQKKEKEWLNNVRNAYKLLPGYKGLRKNASAILVGSMATKEQMPDWVSDKLFYLPENSIDRNRFSLRNTSNYELPVRAAFVGRLVPYKGADMAIEAMENLAKEGKIVFDIYGSGPEEEALKQLVESKSLQGKINVHGFVPNNILQEKLVTADIFVFPSIREFGGGVVLEAMALGVVPVIADYAGPAELVNDGCGYLIPMGDRQQLIKNVRTCLESIVANPKQLESKRQACFDRIENYYTWEKKAEQILEVYAWLQGEAEKPDFQQPFA